MKHHHSHIALLVIACSVTILVYAVYGYMRHRVSVSLDRVISGKEAFAAQNSSEHQQDSIKSVFESTVDDRVATRAFFVADTDTIPFIEMIEALGPASGSTIDLSAIEAEQLDPTNPQATGSIRARVDVRGSWSSVMKALMLAERLPYAVMINSVRVDASGGSEKSTEWKASFAVSALTAHAQQSK